MTIKEAVKQRHMVRKFTDKPIPADLAELLNARIAENNAAHGLNLKLVTGNSDGIGGMAKMLLTKTVHSYIVLAGKDRADLDEKLGYCGADLCLYAQTLGLNTWWVGGMFSGKGAMKHLETKDVRVNGVIAIGYGQTQGVPHKSKTAAEISQYNGAAPQWFLDGVEALLCAPTALNKQPYMVRGDGDRVSLTAGEGHFAGIDLGIGKYHFEVGAGKDNFQWV
ncbi:MAG: nitroreductase [Oscillospiraceae bacterium]|nr:nitroreductase [Oscillospiraceae bacterium]MBR2889725.1 nitroreductase [Oscillospiraceae bacterium]